LSDNAYLTYWFIWWTLP